MVSCDFFISLIFPSKNDTTAPLMPCLLSKDLSLCGFNTSRVYKRIDNPKTTTKASATAYKCAAEIGVCGVVTHYILYRGETLQGTIMLSRLGILDLGSVSL